MALSLPPQTLPPSVRESLAGIPRRSNIPEPVDLGPEPVRVVLLCAEESSSALQELMKTLHAIDVDFDFVAGVELDSRMALEARSRHMEDALYVICQDEHLDAFSAGHIHDTLLRDGVIGSSHVAPIVLHLGAAMMQAHALARRAHLVAPTRAD